MFLYLKLLGSSTDSMTRPPYASVIPSSISATMNINTRKLARTSLNKLSAISSDSISPFFSTINHLWTQVDQTRSQQCWRLLCMQRSSESTSSGREVFGMFHPRFPDVPSQPALPLCQTSPLTLCKPAFSSLNMIADPDLRDTVKKPFQEAKRSFQDQRSPKARKKSHFGLIP